MNIVITTRHRKIRPDIKQYGLEKLSHLSHYFDRITSIHMVLDFEKSGMKSAELIVAASGGTTLIAQQKHIDPHAAIDSAVHKLQAQLKRHKEKLQERGRKRRSES